MKPLIWQSVFFKMSSKLKPLIQIDILASLLYLWEKKTVMFIYPVGNNLKDKYQLNWLTCASILARDCHIASKNTFVSCSNCSSKFGYFPNMNRFISNAFNPSVYGLFVLLCTYWHSQLWSGLKGLTWKSGLF